VHVHVQLPVHDNLAGVPVRVNARASASKGHLVVGGARLLVGLRGGDRRVDFGEEVAGFVAAGRRHAQECRYRRRSSATVVAVSPVPAQLREIEEMIPRGWHRGSYETSAVVRGILRHLD